MAIYSLACDTSLTTNRLELRVAFFFFPLPNIYNIIKYLSIAACAALGSSNLKNNNNDNKSITHSTTITLSS